MNARTRFSLGDIGLVALAALCVWAVFPGVGPELAGLPLPDYSCANIQASKVDVVDSLRELCSLKIRDGAGAGGYKREFFGNRWADLDHDGCNTRFEILIRDLHQPRTDPEAPCRVIGGRFVDPYTGTTTNFDRAPGNTIQIDHVVALGDAWASGANEWSPEQRLKYANDPRVLVAASGEANQEKGRLAAQDWLPSNKSFRCAYARQQINIKYRWGLTVTASERARLLQTLRRC